MENELKLVIKSKNKEVNIVVSSDIGIYEIMDEIANLLIAYGFHPETVKNGFLGKVEDYEES